MTRSTLSPTLIPLTLDLSAATLVRPGSLADVARLQYLGARILHRGTYRDASGAIWPCITVRLGRAQVVVVLSAAGCERAHHPPGAADGSGRRRKIALKCAVRPARAHVREVLVRFHKVPRFVRSARARE